MSIIKQISVFDGSSWNTDNIGANAGNIDLMNAEGTAASTIAGSTNLLTGLNNILPASKLTASRVLVSNSSGVINTSSITSTLLGRLNGLSDNVQSTLNEIKDTIANHRMSYEELPSDTTAGMNQLVASGIYRIYTSSNSPITSGPAWYVVLVCKFSDTFVTQMAMTPTTNYGDKIYARSAINGSWTAWKAQS